MKHKAGNFYVELDENKKIVSVFNFKHKPIKKMYLRGLKKAQETRYWHIPDMSHEYTASNQYSGVEKELNWFEYAVFAWCMKWYQEYTREIRNPPIQTFDDMKYLLLELNPDAYFDLLD